MGPRDKAMSMPQRLKESHHTVARLVATGIELSQVAALTGYSYNRVHQLTQAPAMVALIAHYRARIDETFVASVDAYYDLATRNMIAAERHIADHISDLDTEGELLTLKDAIAISRDAADRFGYGKKQTNLNVNADFAALLEKAIQRSGKQIDGAVEPSRIGRHPAGSHSVAPGSLPPLRRIA